MHSERYVDERLVSKFMLKFVYFQILLQFLTYIYYGTNLCRIYREKYLMVRKISVETQSSVYHSIEILNLRYSEVNRKARCNLLANSVRLHSKLDLKFNL